MTKNILRRKEKKVSDVATMNGARYDRGVYNARGTVVKEEMKDVALPTTRPRATARPILSPSNTCTTSVSCISANGLIPALPISPWSREYAHPNRHNPKIIPLTLLSDTAIRFTNCPKNNTPVAHNELFKVPNLATNTPAIIGTIVFATKLLPNTSDICESLKSRSSFNISFSGPMQSWE
jgi:hypothetical protein